MRSVRMTEDEMSRQVARFADLPEVEFRGAEPGAVSPGDAPALPLEALELVEFGHSRRLYSVVGLEAGAATAVTRDAPINGAGGMTMTYAVCPPGTGPALHAHVATYETFTVLQGRFEITYNDDGSGVLVLDRFDVVCIPPGVVRTFRCVSDEDGILQVVITGGVHDRADLDFSHVVGERLREFGDDALAWFEGLGFSFAAKDAATEAQAGGGTADPGGPDTGSGADETPPLPLRKDGPRLSLRMPLDDMAGGRMIRYRYPNGVVGWLVTSYDDFREVLGHPALHAKHFVGEPQPSPVSVSLPFMPGFIASMNGPEHLRMRRMVGAEFSVARVEAFKPTLDAIIDRNLDHIVSLGSPCDLYANYNLPIPSEVIGSILGVPPEHSAEFQEAARLTIGGLPTAQADPDAPARAIATLDRIVADVLEARRREPADDLITKMALATDPVMTDEEIKGLCTNLLLAGHETTASSSCMVIGILLEDRELLQTFRAHPERLGPSIDELIKYQSMVRDAPFGVPRLATEDVEINGQRIPAGDWVMPSTAFANADAAVCPHAATAVDLERDPMPHWVTFGFGPHTCLGQHLARAEVQAMVWKLFDRLPDIALEIPFDEVPWLEKGFGYRMAELSVTF